MATPAKQSRLEESSIASILSHELPVQWERGRMIGKGGCGTVYLVRDKDNPDQELFVVKDIFVTEKDKVEITKQFKTETTVLRTSETHPRIVQFFGYCQINNTFSIFLQYLKNGSLTDYININGKLLEPKIQLFTRQILEAVVFLHDNNIIHRDINGKNILLEDEENIRLTDFGISKILKDVTSTGTACVGTYRWMAPEVFTADNTIQKYNKKADIWSIGCTVVEMITGEDPYPKCKNEANLFLTIGHNKEPPQYRNASVNCEDFLNKTFTVDPIARPSAKDLLVEDPFINSGQTETTIRMLQEHRLPRVLLQKMYSGCHKNAGHEKFIPVQLFQMSHLPKSCQDNELFELIKAIAELTVLVRVRFTSYDRPKTGGAIINGQYPLYSNRGSDFLRSGSGMIDLENYEILTDVCNCKNCQKSNSPENTGFTFNVVTARHVTYDHSEATKTECRLFYDEEKTNYKYVQGVSIFEADTSADRCVMKCVSHDMTLLEHLNTTWQRYKDLNSIVTGRYKHQKDNNKLCVVVSHPHGAPKHVTVGEWAERVSCGMVPIINIPLTKYRYTTTTCPGSAGAPVFILGSGTGMYHHTHCGGREDYNYSGMFFD